MAYSKAELSTFPAERFHQDVTERYVSSIFLLLRTRGHAQWADVPVDVVSIIVSYFGRNAQLFIAFTGEPGNGKSSLCERLARCPRTAVRKECGAEGFAVKRMQFLHTTFPNGRNATLAVVPGQERSFRPLVSACATADIVVLCWAVDRRGTARYGDTMVLPTYQCRSVWGFPGQRFIKCVTMMDRKGFTQAEFDRVTAVARGGAGREISIPVCAEDPDGNIWRRCPRMPWYKGPTLVEAIEGCALRHHGLSLPPVLPALRVLRVRGGGSTDIFGRCGGSIAVGERFQIFPKGTPCSVESIQSLSGAQLRRAEVGECVTVRVNAPAPPHNTILVHEDYRINTYWWLFARVFTGTSPGQHAVRVGVHYTLHFHSIKVPAKIYEIVSMKDTADADVPVPEGGKHESIPMRFKADCKIRLFAPVALLSTQMQFYINELDGPIALGFTTAPRESWLKPPPVRPQKRWSPKGRSARRQLAKVVSVDPHGTTPTVAAEVLPNLEAKIVVTNRSADSVSVKLRDVSPFNLWTMCIAFDLKPIAPFSEFTFVLPAIRKLTSPVTESMIRRLDDGRAVLRFKIVVEFWVTTENVFVPPPPVARNMRVVYFDFIVENRVLSSAPPLPAAPAAPVRAVPARAAPVAAGAGAAPAPAPAKGKKAPGTAPTKAPPAPSARAPAPVMSNKCVVS